MSVVKAEEARAMKNAVLFYNSDYPAMQQKAELERRGFKLTDCVDVCECGDFRYPAGTEAVILMLEQPKQRTTAAVRRSTKAANLPLFMIPVKRSHWPERLTAEAVEAEVSSDAPTPIRKRSLNAVPPKEKWPEFLGAYRSLRTQQTPHQQMLAPLASFFDGSPPDADRLERVVRDIALDASCPKDFADWYLDHSPVLMAALKAAPAPATDNGASPDALYYLQEYERLDKEHAELKRSYEELDGRFTALVPAIHQEQQKTAVAKQLLEASRNAQTQAEDVSNRLHAEGLEIREKLQQAEHLLAQARDSVVARDKENDKLRKELTALVTKHHKELTAAEAKNEASAKISKQFIADVEAAKSESKRTKQEREAIVHLCSLVDLRVMTADEVVTRLRGMLAK